MIKAIDKELKIYRQICDECQVELEFEYEDIYEGMYGGHYIKCPKCGREVYVPEIGDVKLTEDNIEFPKHFDKVSKDAVNISNEEIQNRVRYCLKNLKADDETRFFNYLSGDTAVFALKWGDEYDIYVCKNYWQTYIPKENCK